MAFQRFAFKVSEIIGRKEPQAKFKNRKLFLYYAIKMSPTKAAEAVIQYWHNTKNRR